MFPFFSSVLSATEVMGDRGRSNREGARGGRRNITTAAPRPRNPNAAPPQPQQINRPPATARQQNVQQQPQQPPRQQQQQPLDAQRTMVDQTMGPETAADAARPVTQAQDSLHTPGFLAAFQRFVDASVRKSVEDMVNEFRRLSQLPRPPQSAESERLVRE